jgi:KDO2-lipid IV(A) lauroyltransferase
MALDLVRYRVAQALTAALPSTAAFRLAELAADAQWRRSACDRRAVQANLTMLTGEAVPEASPLVRDVFRHFGAYLVEFFSVHRRSLRTIVVEGIDEVARQLGAQRNGIVLSAHVGNWELGGIVLSWLGFRVSIVALPHRERAVNRLFDDQRRRCGVDVIPLDAHAAGRSLETLRQGRWLGLNGDREFGRGGVSSRLFSRQVQLPGGPAILSIRSGRPVVPLFLLRRGPWRFRFHVEAPIWPSCDGARHHRVAALTQRYAEAIERCLQQAPAQWLMLRPFFQVGG